MVELIEVAILMVTADGRNARLPIAKRDTRLAHKHTLYMPQMAWLPTARPYERCAPRKGTISIITFFLITITELMLFG